MNYKIKVSREEKVRVLLDLPGTRRWQKSDHDRIYIPVNALVNAYGLYIERNNIGQVMAARFKGQPIGVELALKLWDKITGDFKPYYNVNEDHIHGTYSQKTVINNIFKKAAESTPQLSLWETPATQMSMVYVINQEGFCFSKVLFYCFL